MQVVTTIKNPRKPRYQGLKVTFAQSPDEMQLLLNYGILKAISTPEASVEAIRSAIAFAGYATLAAAYRA
ncbi:hypothetical protein Ctob_011036 [Chrysochromulina tobinii]|uniref:Uncharacterized protein n=1 Tax=Chrysochromulina tobinii TaxID=1460289 RepID=A0A0M0K1R3_9EUKA|nr:hypothetical protein Ctob_011036 [Chrysochromulina tobinii]|eukprot:KOO32821.1 hypothetical protein Ctob_011036 [Chrysochromulina sp. CCMP291]